VVEEVGGVRIRDRAATGQRRRDDLQRLVIGAYVDVDPASRGGRRADAARSRPGEPSEGGEGVKPVDLGDEQHREENRVRPLAAPADAPGQIADSPEEGRDRERAQQQWIAVKESTKAGLFGPLHAPFIGPAGEALEPLRLTASRILGRADMLYR